MKWPRTLFSRTLAVIALVSLMFLIFTLSIIGYFMLVPVGKQSADDFASLMIFSAHNWITHSCNDRGQYMSNLEQDYNLRIGNGENLQPVSYKSLPYYYFLEDALSLRTGQTIKLKLSKNETGEDWYWAGIPVQDKTIFVGFPRSHINAQPPLVLMLLLFVGSMATLATAAVLVRHLVTPLELLAQGAKQIGSGEQPELVPESGPEELVTLAHSFNEMAVQVQELLTNRTTLLAGISHDLRTPLARLQLALEMLPADSDTVLIDGMKGDIEQMNCLIGQFLELSRILERGDKQEIEICDMLNDIVNCARRGRALINWQPSTPCKIINNPLALRRIVVNLLENAVRYSENKPVDVSYTCSQGRMTISIRDYGPGIPVDQLDAVFRPFYRLEQSRNTETGGTGLGLSIAKQLADINNLQIRLLPHSDKGIEAIISCDQDSTD